jgi:hypothetical protein
LGELSMPSKTIANSIRLMLKEKRLDPFPKFSPMGSQPPESASTANNRSKVARYQSSSTLHRLLLTLCRLSEARYQSRSCRRTGISFFCLKAPLLHQPGSLQTSR